VARPSRPWIPQHAWASIWSAAAALSMVAITKNTKRAKPTQIHLPLFAQNTVISGSLRPNEPKNRVKQMKTDNLFELANEPE
jgi:hypothetical protein